MNTFFLNFSAEKFGRNRKVTLFYKNIKTKRSNVKVMFRSPNRSVVARLSKGRSDDV